MPLKAFFSHSTRDRPLVERIRARAEGAGLGLYLAEHDRQPGRQLSRKIQRAIDRCGVMVVLLTSKGYDAPYVHQEIGYALKGRKLVIPVVEHTVDPQAALAMLQGVEYVTVDFAHPDRAIDAAVGQLVQQVEEHRRRENLVLGIALISLLLLAIASE